ncbi:alpha/beta fold hydrolase [Nocardia jejuensis]|uniref:alpha/beta fold hydrolase n=1 Tax=Nocardia jejuensis TaxID=328049 RepID=UPI0008350980|nr:alpha/beta hydrolase [Nocardia jejuensis]
MSSPPARAEILERPAHYAGVSTRELVTRGEGPSIVLLHGFADTAETWRGVLGRLPGRNARAVDVLGFGVADAFAPGPLLPQLDRFVDGVLAETGPAVLVGNSLGVAESIRAAQRTPHLVLGIVALDEPTLSANWLARFSRTAFAPRLARVLHRVRMPARPTRWLVENGLRVLLYGSPRRADRHLMRLWGDRYGTTTGLAWMAEHAVRFAHESVSGYTPDPVHCPVLVVHGRRDRIIPVQSGRALHAMVPGSSLIVLPDAGHCPQLDDPAGTAVLITDFIDRRLSARHGEVG